MCLMSVFTAKLLRNEVPVSDRLGEMLEMGEVGLFMRKAPLSMQARDPQQVTGKWSLIEMSLSHCPPFLSFSALFRKSFHFCFHKHSKILQECPTFH